MIYLDNSATTRVRSEVADAMQPFLREEYGNPSSIHAIGKRAHQAISEARAQVATLLNCDADEIHFSPSGTYSNNVALLGRARFSDANGLGKHLITTRIEHPSVIGPAQYLESMGWKVTYLSVNREGLLERTQLESAITSDTSMISMMWANNEIGSVQPIEMLAELAAERQIFFHTDAVQSPGKVVLDMTKCLSGALSLSGHKFFAPKGIGVLFVRKGTNLMPITFGGGQEKGLMPSTEALSNIVGLGEAARLAYLELANNSQHLVKMQGILIEGLSTIEGIRFTGPDIGPSRLPGHVSFAIPTVEGESIVLRSDLQGLCVSSGSACHKGIIEPSIVLRSIGLSDAEAKGSVRVTASRFNTEDECLNAAKIIRKICTKRAVASS